ncbi:hypothetical protein NDU88_006404 [Pleurodeles waltl]|uniref:Uncharacterized protein n=1 Tax=Pleurodeles waltl TaxID=8319 RepID=A0AAV7MEW1_PLEWA|nr:hypothetical protein NDU88_006404 [Pleurodeles waltl]
MLRAASGPLCRPRLGSHRGSGNQPLALAVSPDVFRLQHLRRWPRGWARFIGSLVGPFGADELCAHHHDLFSHALIKLTIY